MAAQRKLLSNGRWHFQHGPMDLVLAAHGSQLVVDAAFEAAWWRFKNLLDELVMELPQLKEPINAQASCKLRGRVARCMWHACAPFSNEYVTPMAAVAGSVAQELIVYFDHKGIDRAWINNGGDIALHFAIDSELSDEDNSFRVGLYSDISKLDAAQLHDGLALDGCIHVSRDMNIRGIATSGWRGRSFSMGIADSVTVLASSASQADAAASIIANAVNLDDPRVVRRPANEIMDQSDLGGMFVTVDVPQLPSALIQHALDAGTHRALQLQSIGLIDSAVLTCQGCVSMVRKESAVAHRRVERDILESVTEIVSVTA